MREILVKYNSSVAVIDSPCEKCALDNSEKCAQHVKIFKHMCNLAHTFGTKIIRTFSFWVGGSNKGHVKDYQRIRPDLSQYLGQVVKGLKPMVKIAEDEGIKMYFESEGSFSGNYHEVRTIIDALDSSR